MQPIINKYVVLYVAHPFGGDLDNVSRAEIQLSKLQKLLPRHTLISPIHNWSYLDYEMTNQVVAISDCVSLLLRCDALVLTGLWNDSAACRITAYIMRYFLRRSAAYIRIATATVTWATAREMISSTSIFFF